LIYGNDLVYTKLIDQAFIQHTEPIINATKQENTDIKLFLNACFAVWDNTLVASQM